MSFFSNWLIGSNGFLRNLAPLVIDSNGFLRNLAPLVIDSNGFLRNLAPLMDFSVIELLW